MTNYTEASRKGDKLDIFEFTHPSQKRKTYLGFDPKSDTVFVPAGLHPGGRNIGFLCASFDGQPIFQHNREILLPSTWMRQELKKDPELLRVLSRMEEAARHAAVTV